MSFNHYTSPFTCVPGQHKPETSRLYLFSGTKLFAVRVLLGQWARSAPLCS